MAQDLYFSDEELVAFRMAQVYENSLTTARIMSLLDDPSLVPGNYDFQHLQDVHKFIFQDFPKAWLEQNEQTAQFFDYLEPNVFQFEPGLLRSEKDAYNPEFVKMVQKRVSEDKFVAIETESIWESI